MILKILFSNDLNRSFCLRVLTIQKNVFGNLFIHTNLLVKFKPIEKRYQPEIDLIKPNQSNYSP